MFVEIVVISTEGWICPPLVTEDEEKVPEVPEIDVEVHCVCWICCGFCVVLSPWFQTSPDWFQACWSFKCSVDWFSFWFVDAQDCDIICSCCTI